MSRAPEPPEEIPVAEHDQRAGRALGSRVAAALVDGHSRSAPQAFAGSVAARTTAGAVGVARAKRAQALVGARQRELRAAVTLDEVAAPHAALVLERLEHVVDGGEPARDALGVRRLARDDAVAIEERARERGAPVGVARGPPRDATSASDQRPSLPGGPVRGARGWRTRDRPDVVGGGRVRGCAAARACRW